MVNLLFTAVTVLSIALGSGQADCQANDRGVEDAVDVVFLQTALTTSPRAGPVAPWVVALQQQASLTAERLVKAGASSPSSSMVMVVVIVVMLFLIPMIVYMLSDGGSARGGRLLMEQVGAKAQAGPSHAGSARVLRTPQGVAGSQRVSVESQAMPPTSQQYSPSDGPPVICRELVLPETEARFLIEASSLRSEGARVVTILGGSGRQPLLVAYLQDHGPRGFQLWLHSMGQNSTVLDTPRAVVVPGSSVDHFQIYDRDLKLYGELDRSPGRLTLLCNGYAVLSIDETSDELHYNATQMDGRILATGRLAPDVPSHVLAKLGGEAWRLRVVAGCDAIVILSTMLTAILMKQLRPATSAGSQATSRKPSMIRG